MKEGIKKGRTRVDSELVLQVVLKVLLTSIEKQIAKPDLVKGELVSMCTKIMEEMRESYTLVPLDRK
jgi:hypothetical protein